MKTRPAKIILASGNKKKVAELQLLLQPLGISIVPQSGLGISDADEIGLTFVENAIIKARHAAQLSGLPAIADDSGIEVDALNGQPGIYSARFYSRETGNNTNNNDADNNRLLLEKLKDIPQEKRNARFQCVVVYLRHAEDPTPLICQGTWEGRILFAAQGENGFGYDPLFFPQQFWSLTPQRSAAQLPAEEKSKISHRGQAMQQLLQKLQNDGG